MPHEGGVVEAGPRRLLMAQGRLSFIGVPVDPGHVAGETVGHRRRDRHQAESDPGDIRHHHHQPRRGPVRPCPQPVLHVPGVKRREQGGGTRRSDGCRRAAWAEPTGSRLPPGGAAPAESAERRCRRGVRPAELRHGGPPGVAGHPPPQPPWPGKGRRAWRRFLRRKWSRDTATVRCYGDPRSTGPFARRQPGTASRSRRAG